MSKKALFICIFILSAVFYADRIRASRIYEQGDRVQGCLFSANCDHFNVLLLDEF